MALISSLVQVVPFHNQISTILRDVVISVLKTGPIPTHVAFVLDGNRRYAKQHNLPLKEGHTAGATNLVAILDVCYKLGIKAVTVYAFSIENFNRPKAEVDTLFQLLREKLQFLSEADSFSDRNKVKVKIIGNRSYIPEDVLVDLERIEKLTSEHKSHILNVCFPYTSRDDITHCIENIAKDVSIDHKYGINDIDETKLNTNMYFGDEYPDIDILIRTSGHTRLSDFMLWQTNQNSVIIFDNTLWPNFHSFNLFVHLIKWSYYKSLLIREAEVVELRNPSRKMVALQDLRHPPYASVTGR